MWFHSILAKKRYIIATLFFITSHQRGNPFTTARFVDLAERFSLGRCYPVSEDSKNSPEHASLSRNRFEDWPLSTNNACSCVFSFIFSWILLWHFWFEDSDLRKTHWDHHPTWFLERHFTKIPWLLPWQTMLSSPSKWATNMCSNWLMSSSFI